MKEEYFVDYVIENGKMKKAKVLKKDVMKEIDGLIEADKEILDILARM